MEYRKFGNRYLVRMDPGDEVLAKLTEFCRTEKIALGEVRALGTITEKDGEVYLHLHLAASGADGNAIGGHLNKAVISGTLEMVVEPMEGHAGRTVNPLTGLNDIAF